MSENGQKHKKLFFSAPERARTVLNAFLECMYFEFGLDGRTDAVHISSNYVGYRNYVGFFR